MKKRFIGDLKSINPNSLIDRNNKDETEIFFITLAFVYNDLKDLIFFQQNLVENYEATGDISYNTGEYNGITNHLHRLVLSFLHEFLDFISINSKVFLKDEFKLLLKDLTVEEREIWESLQMIPSGDKSPAEVSDLKSILRNVRGNVTYHYKDAGKNLRTGFIQRFFEKNKIEFNEKAFYSIGDTMKETRFLYADAAAEEYLFKEVRKDSSSKKDIKLDIDEFKKHKKEISNLLVKINFLIMKILKLYIKKRPRR